MTTVTLDLHGFKKTHTVNALRDSLIAPLQMRLAGMGCMGGDILEGQEEKPAIFAIRFQLRDRTARLYQCAACPLCQPYQIASFIREAARLASHEAGQEVLAQVRRLARRAPSVAALFAAQRRARRRKTAKR